MATIGAPVAAVAGIDVGTPAWHAASEKAQDMAARDDTVNPEPCVVIGVLLIALVQRAAVRSSTGEDQVQANKLLDSFVPRGK